MQISTAGARALKIPTICKLWGQKADTSNNAMEYQAMLSAMELLPEKSFVCIGTDSQTCLDGLTKWRKRWEKHSRKRGDGQEVANADLIRPLVDCIEKREGGFRKIKGHGDDFWNDIADSLAVKGGNAQAKEVIVQLVFRAVINGKEKTVCFDRVSVDTHANIYDFWPKLVAKCGDVIGAPEDYEIWHDRLKLARPLIMGEQYETSLEGPQDLLIHH
jgi:ribonuclease HI